MTLANIGEILLVAVPLLGTGGWVGWIIKNHDKRIVAMEQAMPSDLKKRLTTVEREKLDETEHDRTCAQVMKNVETQVSMIKKTIEDHAGRLAKGDELFRELSALAGEMRGILAAGAKNGNKHVCPFMAEK